MAKSSALPPHSRKGCGFTGLGPSCSPGGLHGFPPPTLGQATDEGEPQAATGFHRWRRHLRPAMFHRQILSECLHFPTSQKSVDPFPAPPMVRHGARKVSGASGRTPAVALRLASLFCFGFFFFWRREVSVGSAQEAAMHQAVPSHAPPPTLQPSGTAPPLQRKEAPAR